jgi:hypothetical protein
LVAAGAPIALSGDHFLFSVRNFYVCVRLRGSAVKKSVQPVPNKKLPPGSGQLDFRKLVN